MVCVCSVAVTPKALVAVTPKALGGDPAYLGHDLFFFNVDTAKEQRQRAVCGWGMGPARGGARKFFGYSPLALSQ